jgi:hypothetical protein
MNLPLAAIWGQDPGSGALIGYLVGAFILGVVMMVAMTKMPTRGRKPIVWIATFASGFFYFLFWIWPSPINRGPSDLPVGFSEKVGFGLQDALPKVANIAIILTAFLLGLGIYSLLHVHLGRLFKKQKDWQFSLILVVSMVLMIIFGYWDWMQRQFNDPDLLLAKMDNWGFVNYSFDLLFDGLLQQMDAAMFSMIAFFILSAAYRAFRIKSIEATVLMASALIMILSIMGAVDMVYSNMIDSMTGGDPGHFLNDAKITAVASWVKNTMQVPALRALEFGVGLGALAMGLRLWLGLEKGGVS